MRGKPGRRSSNVEDRRGTRPSRRAVGGGVDTLMLVLVALCPGVDPRLVPHWASPAATAAATLPARSIPIP